MSSSDASCTAIRVTGKTLSPISLASFFLIEMQFLYGFYLKAMYPFVYHLEIYKMDGQAQAFILISNNTMCNKLNPE